MESRLNPLSKPFDWLAIFFILFLAIHVYLAYPYFSLEAFNVPEEGFLDYVFSTAPDFIALLILPFAIWLFIKKTPTGWVLIVTWLLLRISFDVYFFSYLFNFLHHGGTILQPDGWIVFYAVESILLAVVLIYLLTGKNRQKFNVKKSNVIWALVMSAILFSIFFLMIHLGPNTGFSSP